MSKTDTTATTVEQPATRAASARASAAPAAATSKAIPLTGIALGIDVGGTGVKAALVDLATAELITSRIREKTPQPSEPAAVIDTVASVVSRVLAEHKPVKDLAVGCGLPGAIKYGYMKTAANLDKGWVDLDATTALSQKLGTDVHVINDADAAGMAELAYGEAKGRPGTTILLTIGTGIGSALISEGRLVPNTEFGHLIMRKKASETLVSGAARTRRRLSWKAWATEFNEYLAMLEFFLWPDRIILGGGVSKESDRYWEQLVTNAELVKARFLNTSGIIGAAYAAGLAAHEEAAARKPSPRSTRRAGPPRKRA
ncbi:MAG: ROK family protein [Candidatus Limnocylindrales bacterium]